MGTVEKKTFISKWNENKVFFSHSQNVHVKIHHADFMPLVPTYTHISLEVKFYLVDNLNEYVFFKGKINIIQL